MIKMSLDYISSNRVYKKVDASQNYIDIDADAIVILSFLEHKPCMNVSVNTIVSNENE